MVNLSFAVLTARLLETMAVRGRVRAGRGRARTGRGTGEERARRGESRARNGRGRARNGGVQGCERRRRKTLVFEGCERVSRAK